MKSLIASAVSLVVSVLRYRKAINGYTTRSAACTTELIAQAANRSQHNLVHLSRNYPADLDIQGTMSLFVLRSPGDMTK